MLFTLNRLPELSSLIVATPVEETPPAFVATKLNVSLLSGDVSLTITTRTNSLVLPAGIGT